MTDVPRKDDSQGVQEDICMTRSKFNASGHVIGPQAASPWLQVYPKGMYNVLNWVRNRYNSPIIYVTENGCDVPGESDMPLKEALQDTFR